MKILVLTNSPAENVKLEDAAKQRGHELRFVNPSMAMQYISQHERGLDRLYLANDDKEPERIFSKDVDVVIPRIGDGIEYGSALLRFCVENLGAYSPVSGWGLHLASNKAWCLQKLSADGIHVPKTIVTCSPKNIAWIVEQLKLPVIVKTWSGSCGRTVGICDSKQSANSLFSFAVHAGLKILLEEYIETGGVDYRVWVVGDKVAVAMKRTSNDKKDFRANISLGGKGEKVQLSEQDEALCIRAAHSCGLQVCAVDLMKDANGVSYIIELNSNGGLKVVDITGVNPFIDVIKLCEDNYKKHKLTPSGTSALSKESMLLNDDFFTSAAQLMNQNKILKDALKLKF